MKSFNHNNITEAGINLSKYRLLSILMGALFFCGMNSQLMAVAPLSSDANSAVDTTVPAGPENQSGAPSVGQPNDLSATDYKANEDKALAKADAAHDYFAQWNYNCAATAFQNAQEPNNAGKVAKLYNQAGEYYSQSADTSEKGDIANSEFFQGEGYAYDSAATAFQNAQEPENAGKVAKLYNKAGEYYLQASDASEKGDETNYEDLLDAAESYNSATTAFEAAQKPENAGKVAEAYHKEGEYYLQAGDVAAQRDVTNFADLIDKTNSCASAVSAFEEAKKPKNAGIIAKTYEEAGKFYLQYAEETQGDKSNNTNFNLAADAYNFAAFDFQNAKKPENKGTVSEMYYQAAQCFLQAGDALVQSDVTKYAHFRDKANNYNCAAGLFDGAKQAESVGSDATWYYKAGEYYLQQANALSAQVDTTNPSAQPTASN